MSMDEEADPFDIYLVVRNDRGDHSIWPAIKPLPSGWVALGVQDTREDCLNWIDKNWSGPSLS